MHLKSWTWASRELEALLRPTNRVRMAFQTLLWLLNMCPLWIAFDAVFPLFLAWIVVFFWCQFPIVYVPAHSFCIVANCAVECQSVNRNDLTFCHFLAWNQDFIVLGKVFHLRVKKTKQLLWLVYLTIAIFWLPIAVVLQLCFSQLFGLKDNI